MKTGEPCRHCGGKTMQVCKTPLHGAHWPFFTAATGFIAMGLLIEINWPITGLPLSLFTFLVAAVLVTRKFLVFQCRRCRHFDRPTGTTRQKMIGWLTPWRVEAD